MRVTGLSNYYAYMYNRSTGKITSESDDGFADFFNGDTVECNTEYSTRKAGIERMISFFRTPGSEKNFFNSTEGSDECTIIQEKVSDEETRYYVDGKLLFEVLAGELTAKVSFLNCAVDGTSDMEEDEKVFDDVSSFSISDLKEDEVTEESHKRKSGPTTSQVIVYPDGSRWLITTMYFCGKEIKITKRLPPLDEASKEDDDLLRQDNEEMDEDTVQSGTLYQNVYTEDDTYLFDDDNKKFWKSGNEKNR